MPQLAYTINLPSTRWWWNMEHLWQKEDLTSTMEYGKMRAMAELGGATFVTSAHATVLQMPMHLTHTQFCSLLYTHKYVLPTSLFSSFPNCTNVLYFSMLQFLVNKPL